MKKLSLLSIFALWVGMGSIVSAADILLIGDPANVSNISITDFLISEGHSVTREVRSDGPGNANEFDLVIVEPSANSNNYNGSDRAAEWNAVTAPVLCMQPFIYVSTNWGWITSGNIGNIDSASMRTPYDLPDHPFVSGLIDPIGDITTDLEVRITRPALSAILSSGVTLIAQNEPGFNMALFTIDEGTALSDNRNTAAGGIRIAWALAEGAGANGVNVWGSINSNGEQIMRNIIAIVVPESPQDARITSVVLEPGSGDFLVNFSPAGSNYVLMSSNDLVSSFEEETSAILENGNATFRVPASNLNLIRDFFRIERAP